MSLVDKLSELFPEMLFREHIGPDCVTIHVYVCGRKKDRVFEGYFCVVGYEDTYLDTVMLRVFEIVCAGEKRQGY